MFCNHLNEKCQTKIYVVLLIVAAGLVFSGCYKNTESKGSNMYKKYAVVRTQKPAELKGDWDGKVWGGVEKINVKHFMGNEPEHQPKTQAKVLYDDEFIYVIFRVEDKYVRAISEKHQDGVCRDSCVEFFFTPGKDVSKGYFNIEINCGGTMLFCYQPEPSKNTTPLSEAECNKVAIYHSEPKIIDPEKQEPTTWIVEYSVPFDILTKYSEVSRPGPGVTWRANFYKCADLTSHPHWLTWSVVDLPGPNFHRPDFFGTLEFK